VALTGKVSPETALAGRRPQSTTGSISRMGIRPITTKRYRVTGARREGGLARSLPGLWPGNMNVPDLRVRSATLADLDAIVGLHIAARNAYCRASCPSMNWPRSPPPPAGAMATGTGSPILGPPRSAGLAATIRP
jgi:hypothetical protein